MSSNFVQFGHQSNLENFLKSTNVEELDDADLMAVNGGADYFNVGDYKVQIDAAAKAEAEAQARTQYDIKTGAITVIPKGLTDFLASQK